MKSIPVDQIDSTFTYGLLSYKEDQAILIAA